MRLIDADALKYTRVRIFHGLNEDGTPCVGGENAIVMSCTIKDAPTVDAVEVVHGEWEKYTDDRFMGYGADGRIRYRKVYSYKCSKCWNYTAVKHKYCPNCGADMRERKNEDGNEERNSVD